MTTSRTIHSLALSFALAVLVGCGSKPAPTQPPAPEPDKNTPEPPKPKDDDTKKDDNKTKEQPKTEPPKVVWELDVEKHAVPAAPVRGRVAGVEVTPEVIVTREELSFRVVKAGSPMAERTVSLRLGAVPPGQPIPQILGRSWKVKSDSAPGPTVPEIWLEVQGQPIVLSPNGYALTLELGMRKDGKVAGKIYLSMSDKEQTVLAGTFNAEYFRSEMEPPSADDAPFVMGDVALVGAAADTKVRVGYAAFQMNGGVQFTESVTTTKRYEHTRIEPGRYLIVAALPDGPATWKWVNVPANGMLTENLTLDVAKAGGLEITAPLDAKGAILIAPADEPGRPLMEETVFKGFSLLVVRNSPELVAGKALVKNLGVGKYEVRLGEERRMVEIVAGKTAEVNFTPPKK
jgi:hypothetical protein